MHFEFHNKHVFKSVWNSSEKQLKNANNKVNNFKLNLRLQVFILFREIYPFQVEICTKNVPLYLKKNLQKKLRTNVELKHQETKRKTE